MLPQSTAGHATDAEEDVKRTGGYDGGRDVDPYEMELEIARRARGRGESWATKSQYGDLVTRAMGSQPLTSGVPAASGALRSLVRPEKETGSA